MNTGTLVSLSNDLRSHVGSLSLVNCINEVKSIVDTYPMEKTQHVAWGVLKGMAVGGTAGALGAYGGAFATLTSYAGYGLMDVVWQIGLRQTMINVVTNTFALTALGPMVTGASVIGAGYGGIKNAWDTHTFNQQAELASRMEDVLARSLNFIKANYRANDEAKRELDERFIQDIRTDEDVISWNPPESFQINTLKFDAFNKFESGLSNRIKLVFFIAIYKIDATRRSGDSLRAGFESLIYETPYNEKNRELICFSRFHLARCYLEIGNTEGAISQYRQVINGSLDTFFKEAVNSELNNLI